MTMSAPCTITPGRRSQCCCRANWSKPSRPCPISRPCPRHQRIPRQHPSGRSSGAAPRFAHRSALPLNADLEPTPAITLFVVGPRPAANGASGAQGQPGRRLAPLEEIRGGGRSRRRRSRLRVEGDRHARPPAHNMSSDARLAVFLWTVSLLGAAAILIIAAPPPHAGNAVGAGGKRPASPRRPPSRLRRVGAACAVLGVVIARAVTRRRGGI